MWEYQSIMCWSESHHVLCCSDSLVTVCVGSGCRASTTGNAMSPRAVDSSRAINELVE
jgi:hypothetical protein